MAMGKKMINDYNVNCKCGFKSKVKYGRLGKNEVYEVFSCPNCKNLFTLHFNDELKCRKCKNTKLASYNPNKMENLAFYKRMSKNNMLLKSKLKELEEFWKNIKDNECPKCGKKQLVWRIMN